jgi:hypothetical protein
MVSRSPQETNDLMYGSGYTVVEDGQPPVQVPIPPATTGAFSIAVNTSDEPEAVL